MLVSMIEFRSSFIILEGAVVFFVVMVPVAFGLMRELVWTFLSV